MMRRRCRFICPVRILLWRMAVLSILIRLVTRRLVLTLRLFVWVVPRIRRVSRCLCLCLLKLRLLTRLTKRLTRVLRCWLSDRPSRPCLTFSIRRLLLCLTMVRTKRRIFLRTTLRRMRLTWLLLNSIRRFIMRLRLCVVISMNLRAYLFWVKVVVLRLFVLSLRLRSLLRTRCRMVPWLLSRMVIRIRISVTVILLYPTLVTRVLRRLSMRLFAVQMLVVRSLRRRLSCWLI